MTNDLDLHIKVTLSNFIILYLCQGLRCSRTVAGQNPNSQGRRGLTSSRSKQRLYYQDTVDSTDTTSGPEARRNVSADGEPVGYTYTRLNGRSNRFFIDLIKFLKRSKIEIKRLIFKPTSTTSRRIMLHRSTPFFQSRWSMLLVVFQLLTVRK